MRWMLVFTFDVDKVVLATPLASDYWECRRKVSKVDAIMQINFQNLLMMQERSR